RARLQPLPGNPAGRRSRPRRGVGGRDPVIVVLRVSAPPREKPSVHCTYNPRMTLLLGIYAFAIGAIVGSFLNVVIHRYPREESIVFPGSHCPQCDAAIRWYDNIPVISFVALRGRC